MDTCICCGLHVYIYKNLILFQGLFPALSDDTEIRNTYATIASQFPTLAMMLKRKGKVHPCTVTEALCRPYGP